MIYDKYDHGTSPLRKSKYKELKFVMRFELKIFMTF